MLTKFQNHINVNFPFLKEKKLLLAVSGGMDSMVLVYLCHQLKLDFAVAHCNFQMRGDESDGDENFVISETEKLKIPVFVNHFETKEFAEQQKLSIQVVARNLRYDWFCSLIENNEFDYLLTAHHLDDSLETFLINFTRGSGLDGLTGIPSQNNNIIRPLLVFSRNEISTFAIENNIKWRDDSSNASDKYLRNKLRHKVIPLLKELNPSLLSSFETIIHNLQQAKSLVDDAARMVYEKTVVEEGNQIKIDISKLMKFNSYKAYLYQWLQVYGFSAWEDIYGLVHAQSGKQIFSDTYVLLKDRDFMILHPLLRDNKNEVFFINKNQKEVNFPLKITFCNTNDILNVTTNTIFVDENKLTFPLILRHWQEGDWFYPLGMTGKKKVSKFFKDEKYSLIDKSNTWLLCSDNQIVWIVGKRQDERFKVSEGTTNIIQINYIK